MEPSGKKTSPLARALMVTFEPLMSAMRVLALAFLAESFAPESESMGGGGAYQ